jgi:excisionase family DNA binding protein
MLENAHGGTTLEHPVFTRSEAAAYLGVSLPTLARWAGQGTGPNYYRLGRHARYRISDLDAFIMSRKVVHRLSDTGGAHTIARGRSVAP